MTEALLSFRDEIILIDNKLDINNKMQEIEEEEKK